MTDIKPEHAPRGLLQRVTQAAAPVSVVERELIPGTAMFQWSCACDNRGPWVADRITANRGAEQHWLKSGWHYRWLKDQETRGITR